MSHEIKPRFAHRRKEDGSHDSICLACLQTISSSAQEADLSRDDEEHVCKYAFPARRARSLTPDGKNGRRQSDRDWQDLLRA